MKKLFLIIALAITAQASASSVDNLFTEGNRFYEKQQYDSALQRYTLAETQGMNNADLLYNKGNASQRLGLTGQAILNWEKALKLSPGHVDAKANLAFARARITDRIPEPQSDFLGMVLLKIHTGIPLPFQLWMTAILLLTLSGLAAWWLFATSKLRPWIAYGMGILLLPLCYSIPSATIKIKSEILTPRAIILVPQISAVNEPQGRTAIFTAHEGTTVTIVKSEGGWCFVSLPNGASGWIEEAKLGRI